MTESDRLDKVAIVDLGSNTAKMSIFLLQPGRWYRQIDELRAVVRLSSGTAADGSISPAAFERAAAALERFRAYLDAAGVKRVLATATSAVRSAANGGEFVRAAKQRSGFDLRVLSGEEEAGYGALAVANSLAVEDALVLDVGGGSAQLSLLRGRRVARAMSWPLGAVSLTERFCRGDPPTASEIAAMRAYIRRHLAEWFVPSQSANGGLPLIGMGGTVRNVANLSLRAEQSQIGFLHGYSMPGRTLAKLTTRLLGLKTAQRRELEALSADRADIIAAGAVVVHEVVKAAGVDAMTVSGQGLREGLLYPLLLPGKEPALVDDVRQFSIANLIGRSDGPVALADKSKQVARLALELFAALPASAEPAFERDLLAAAARLHEIGRPIDYRDYHKHGYQLIMSNPLNGYSHREQALIALLVRYHRSGQPRLNGMRGILEDGDLDRLKRLAGVLRVAASLDRTGAQLVTGLRCEISGTRLEVGVKIACYGPQDPGLAMPRRHSGGSRTVSTDGGIGTRPAPVSAEVEIHHANEASGLLASSYGLSVEFRAL